MPSAPRIIGSLTALLMAWTAVWCCCLPSAGSAATQATSAPPVTASCCVAEKDDAKAKTDASHCPVRHRENCPVLRLRECSMAPQPPVVLTPAVDWALLPDWFTPLPALATTPVNVRAAESAEPPPPRLSLLALHTSLVW